MPRHIEDWRLTQIAKACGQVLRTRGSKVVWCEACKAARMDGPEYCPTCGGPLRAIADVKPGKPVHDEVVPPEPVELPTSVEIARSVYAVRRGPPAKLYAFRGEMLTLEDIANRVGGGMTRDTLRTRLKYGWSMERACSEPLHAKRIVPPPSCRISHPDYVPTSEKAIATIEKVLIMADQASSVDENLLGLPMPDRVKLIRERCQRLDEIDYELGLLHKERQEIIAKLEKGETK